MKLFFSYDYRDRFELHNSLEAAKAAAQEALDCCRDEAIEDGGWQTEVNQICYGELRGQAVETLREPWDEDKHGTPPEDGCERVEYDLQDYLTTPRASLEAAAAAEEVRNALAQQSADVLHGDGSGEALPGFSQEARIGSGVAVGENVIKLTPAEIQSGMDRVKWAEGLIRQLPEHHDGRNSWLLNFGTEQEGES